MLPINPAFFARSIAVPLPFEVFSFAPGALDAVPQPYRMIVWGFPSGGTKIQVTIASMLGMSANPPTAFKASKVAVGKLITGAYTQPSTQAVPTEITFSDAVGGPHGIFYLGPGEVIRSDEINFSFAVSDKLVFVCDIPTSGSGYCAAIKDTSLHSELWGRGTASATQATVTGFVNQGPIANAAAFVHIGAR